jgi:hypothetical protein
VVVYYGGRVQAMGPLKDLLAKPDSLRITTPVLPRDTLEKVLAVLRTDVAEDQVRVETPTQNLESYFLGVVEAARASEAQTSGALSGSQVAAYLRGEAEESIRTDRVLDRLTRASAGPTPIVTVAQSAEKVNHGLLESLVAAPSESAGAVQPASEEPATPADLGEANEKLSSLLRKPKS